MLVTERNAADIYQVIGLDPRKSYTFPLIYTWNGNLKYLGSGFHRIDDPKRIESELKGLL